MNRTGLCLSALLSAFALPTGLAAAQDLSACGDIRLEAEAQCVFVPPSVMCETSCTPIRLEAACAAELYVECGGTCNADIDVDCSGGCFVDCQGDCEVDPGVFDCRGACELDCEGACMAECATDGSMASCEASCQGICAGECDARCNIVPPTADCDAKCEASCEGSCEAQANLDCHLGCQADGFAECQARLEGGCMTDCMEERGALFCDGQYVDPRDDVEACVEALRAALNINVEGYAEASGECNEGRCEGMASAGVGCSALPPATSQRAAAGVLGSGFIAAGLLLVFRRRRRG